MKFTGTIGSGYSGSLGGVVASTNRFGSYFRTRAIPVNPQTSFQQTVRSTFATLASRWTDVLTAAQRSAWSTYALNAGTGLTGLNQYVACNSVRRQTTPVDATPLAYVDDAPTTFSLASLTPPLISPAAGTPADVTVAFTNTDQWATEVGGALFVSISRQYSPSINFFKGPFQVAHRLEGAVVPPTSPAIVSAAFDGATGNKMTARFVACLADGRISAPTFATGIVS
jgi:hypothetical protein